MVRYTLEPATLPAGLSYVVHPDPTATGGMIAGTPAAETAARAYMLTATDVDGDTATLAFTVEVVRTPVRVTVTDGSAEEGRPVEFAVTLSRAVAAPLTLHWTAGRPGSATPGEDHRAVTARQLTVAAGATADTLAVSTLDDRRGDVHGDGDAAGGDLDRAHAGHGGGADRGRRCGAGAPAEFRDGAGGRGADAVDVIGDRFVRQPTAAQATVDGQAVDLDRGPQRGRWRHAVGVAYGVARALGVEVGSPLAGEDGQFGQVRGAAWSTLTRHLRDPHAPTPPLSAWDALGAFAVAPGPGWEGPVAAGWDVSGPAGGAPSIPPPSERGLELAPDLIRGDGAPAWGNPVGGGSHFGPAPLPGLGQLGFDRAHAATPQAAAATWTLWGRGTASGFDGKPKADFSMDGNVFTGYLDVDYRLQPTVLLGLAVAHSQGAVDVTLTSILPYAHWSPRPGLGVWGMFGTGWGDLKLRDEAGKVKTDLEMLLGAVGARQEVLTWRRIDVALKADAFLTELEAGADDRLPETAGDAQRLRLMVEGRTAWALSEGSHLTPAFEIGGRWDGGKAETGVGAELGGGVAYAHTKLGLGIEARGGTCWRTRSRRSTNGARV